MESHYYDLFLFFLKNIVYHFAHNWDVRFYLYEFLRSNFILYWFWTDMVSDDFFVITRFFHFISTARKMMMIILQAKYKEKYRVHIKCKENYICGGNDAQFLSCFDQHEYYVFTWNWVKVDKNGNVLKENFLRGIKCFKHLFINFATMFKYLKDPGVIILYSIK